MGQAGIGHAVVSNGAELHGETVSRQYLLRRDKGEQASGNNGMNLPPQNPGPVATRTKLGPESAVHVQQAALPFRDGHAVSRQSTRCQAQKEQQQDQEQQDSDQTGKECLHSVTVAEPDTAGGGNTTFAPGAACLPRGSKTRKAESGLPRRAGTEGLKSE